MKLLDLFSGICGFSHAAEKYGFFTTAFCEIDNFRHRVIQYHYPDKPIYTDIRNVDGKKIEPVNIVTFGSPCQNLSVAGKQEGLKGKESCLFYEAIRIIREMREKTGGLYPRYAVWENVPGAFSSSKGQDFKAVLEAFLETEIPMPESGRWANAGMVRGDGRSVAWRVMDAQYWGVPQRRRRIFLVADFRGQSAPEILFERESVSGDSAESGKTGKEAAESARDGIKSTVPKITGTLCASGAGMNRPAGMANETDLVVAQCLTSGTGGRCNPEIETLIPVVFSPSGYSEYKEGIGTLRANGGDIGGGSEMLIVIDCRNLCENKVSATLQAKGNGGYSLNYQNPVRIGCSVRKLTPLECLRLQGFPDDWLDGMDLSDTVKYRIIGDSVAIPCVEFVLKRVGVANA